jgi:hypothetical protein
MDALITRACDNIDARACKQGTSFPFLNHRQSCSNKEANEGKKLLAAGLLDDHWSLTKDAPAFKPNLTRELDCSARDDGVIAVDSDHVVPSQSRPRHYKSQT